MIASHSSTWTQSDAAAKTEQYRRVLRIVLIVEAIAGLALLIWPKEGADLLELGSGARAAWRLFGLMLITSVTFAWQGRAHPLERRGLNLTFILLHVALFALAALAGLGWVLTGYATLAAIALSVTWRRAARADLMARP